MFHESSEVTIAGQTYLLGTLRLTDYLAMEQQIVAQRPQPLEELRPRLADFTQTQQRVLLEAAYRDLVQRDQVTVDQIGFWLRTRTGQIYRFWRLLLGPQPELTLEDAERLLEKTLSEKAAAAEVDFTVCHPSPRPQPLAEIVQQQTSGECLGKPRLLKRGGHEP